MSRSALYTEGLANDLTLLDDLSNQGISDCLKARLEHSIIYTYIGSVLVSVNPFQPIDGLYSQERIERYSGSYQHENRPHIFAIAENAYYALRTESHNQCIIITGESGAGKTEASKKIMHYLAAVSSGRSEEVLRVKDQLLKSNPVFEAFGNARTVRNNNSSRFGKYLSIVFDFKADPVGGTTQTYLLEKSRVTSTTSPEERSFHIFYQLTKGASAEQREAFQVRDPSNYRYLSQSGCFDVEHMDDTAEFGATLDGLHALQFTQDEIDDILRTVSAILWLGNVEFEAQGETNCSIVDEEPVRRVAELLGSAPEMLTMALTSRTYEAGRRSSFVAKPLNADAARYTRDALAKAIYSRLFDWLVGRINAAIDPSQCMSEYELQDAVSIGVLDIYGFEIFEHNSFEQFCINYVNEKLQQVFIEYTLKSEQEEYERENIEWEPIQFFNNKVVCDLIEKKPVGIIALLDEACILPRGSDRSFLQKCVQHFDGHDHFQLPMDERARSMTRARARSRAFTTTTAEVSEEDTEFIIRHYAGDVTYEVEGFLDKNKDLVWKDLLRFGESADIGIFDHLFPKGCSVDMGNKRPVTAGTQFKRSVHSLMDTLHACTPHYIRCIKPNDQKKGGLYMENLSIHQIRYLGLLENVRVRRAGFTFRQEFGAFLARYKMLSPRTWPLWKGEPAEGVKAILTDKGITGADAYRLGKTKVFIREPTSLYTIEEARDERLHDLTTILSSNWRRYAQRKIYKRFRAVLKIQTRLRGVVQRRAYKRRSAALRIQAQIKRVLAVQRFRRLVSASVLQSHIRRAKARDLFRELIAAVKIQARYRGFATRVWYKQTRAAIRMQAQWRGYAQRTWYKRYCAARQIQRIARGNSARLYVLRLRSALRIQRIFRRWTAQKEFLRLRRQALDLLVGKRRRRRSVQRFFERIYLEEPVEQGVRAALPPDDNNVFFAARGSKVNRSGKSDQRILVLTHNAFHVLSEPKFKVHTSLPIEHISRVSVSTLPDSYFVLHSDATFDVLYCCHEKSELLTYISNLMQERVGQPLPVTVSDDVTFHIKKRKPRTVRFVPQEPPLVPVKPGQPAPELDAVAVKDKKAKDTFVVCVSTHVPFADDHAVESFRHGHVTIPLIRPSMLEDIDEED